MTRHFYFAILLTGLLSVNTGLNSQDVSKPVADGGETLPQKQEILRQKLMARIERIVNWMESWASPLSI